MTTTMTRVSEVNRLYNVMRDFVHLKFPPGVKASRETYEQYQVLQREYTAALDELVVEESAFCKALLNDARLT